MLTNKLTNKVKWIYFFILILGIALSAYVYLRGQQIRHATESLITNDIPTYELFHVIESQLTEQERLLYEYYATEELTLFQKDYFQAREKAMSGAASLTEHFGEIMPLQQTVKNMGLIHDVAQTFNLNIISEQTDWDLAREQLVEISLLRRNIIPYIKELKLLISDEVSTTKQSILDDLWHVRTFVLLYSLLIIVIAFMVGRGIKAYLSASAVSHRLSLFPTRNPNPIISLDEENNVTFSNPASQRMLKKLNKPINDISFLLASNLTAHQHEARKSERHYTRFEYQIEEITFEGELHWLAEEREWDIHLTDVTDRKLAQLKLQFQASHHPETALCNEYEMHKYLEQGCRGNTPYTIALIEIRDYSQLLSSMSIDATTLVNELACLLQAELGKQSLQNASIYHIGDKNFALLIEQPGCEKLASDISNQIEERINANTFHGQQQLVLDIGFSCFPEHGDTSDTMLKSARAALEKAIHDDTNNHVVYTPELGQQIAFEQNMINSIRNAIDSQSFELYFQPQLCLENNHIGGVEVLIRWHHEGNFVSPGEFIPLAEKSGLIVPLGDWILTTACHKAKNMLANGFDGIVAINISPKQFNQSDFVERVVQALKDSQLPPAHLELEITEGVFMYQETDTIETLHKLRDIGVMMSIDDFGTGYSSLSYLKQFPIDKLKIDQSFVKQLQCDDADKAIVQTVIELGNNLNLKLIAEGVEETSQLDILQEMGCHEIQGYHFSRPLPEAKLLEFIEKHNLLKKAY